MIRPFTCVCMVLACGSGLYLYQAKHRVQLLDRDITATVRATEAAQARIGILRAEWTLQNDPEHLSQLADRFLSLKTVTPGQFTTLAELDKRLPPVRVPDAKPAETTDDDTPVASAPEPEPAKTVAFADPRADPPKRDLSPRQIAAPAPGPVKLATAAARLPERRARPMEPQAEVRSVFTPVAAPAPRLLPAPYIAPASAPVVTSVLGIARTSIAPPVPFAPAVSNGGG